MSDKPGGTRDEAAGLTEAERAARSPGDERVKKKPGDAARKMRAMFDGRGRGDARDGTPGDGRARSTRVE